MTFEKRPHVLAERHAARKAATKARQMSGASTSVSGMTESAEKMAEPRASKLVCCSLISVVAWLAACKSTSTSTHRDSKPAPSASAAPHGPAPLLPKQPHEHDTRERA